MGKTEMSNFWVIDNSLIRQVSVIQRIFNFTHRRIPFFQEINIQRNSSVTSNLCTTQTFNTNTMKNCKHLFFSIVIFIWPALLIGQQVYSTQNSPEITLTDIKIEQTAIPVEFFDPEYPVQYMNNAMVFDYQSRTPEMEAYVKTHPAFPVLIVENPTTEQMDEYMMSVESWVAEYGAYYPRFIPYSKYNKQLSPEHDIFIYQSAKAEWEKRNTEKHAVVSEYVKKWAANNADKVKEFNNTNR